MEADVGDDRSRDQWDLWRLWRGPARRGPGEDRVDDAVSRAGLEDVEEVLPQVRCLAVRRTRRASSARAADRALSVPDQVVRVRPPVNSATGR